jgi:hypothetical protein
MDRSSCLIGQVELLEAGARRESLLLEFPVDFENLYPVHAPQSLKPSTGTRELPVKNWMKAVMSSMSKF